MCVACNNFQKPRIVFGIDEIVNDPEKGDAIIEELSNEIKRNACVCYYLLITESSSDLF